MRRRGHAIVQFRNTSRMSCATTLLAAASLGVVAFQTGCTSFTFAETQGPGDAPSDLVDRDDMVTISGGVFQMGYFQGKPDEYPPHEVTLSSFMIDRNEVTNEKYRECVESRVCRPSAMSSDQNVNGRTQPVVGVTFRDAELFCQWIGRRLPTEAEWEFAARAPHFSFFPWEGKFNALVTNGRGSVDGHEFTAPVGSFPAGKSGHGVFDMAGNVAEWTQDWYDPVYYSHSEKKNPTGPDVSSGARVVRGGSYQDNDYLLRASARDRLDPKLAKNSVGFRCAGDVARAAD